MSKSALQDAQWLKCLPMDLGSSIMQEIESDDSLRFWLSLDEIIDHTNDNFDIA